jgi:hypothetical protein
LLCGCAAVFRQGRRNQCFGVSVVDAVAAAAAAWVWLGWCLGALAVAAAVARPVRLFFLGRTGAGCFLFACPETLARYLFVDDLFTVARPARAVTSVISFWFIVSAVARPRTPTHCCCGCAHDEPKPWLKLIPCPGSIAFEQPTGTCSAVLTTNDGSLLFAIGFGCAAFGRA